MKTKNITKLLLVLTLALVILVAGCSKSAAIKAGDKVVALWSGTSWYEGTIDTACDKGWNVKWQDGSPSSCIPLDKVVANKTLTKEEAKVGTAVFAKWSIGAFYEAKITAVDGDKYNVEYSDGTKGNSLALADLRSK